MALTDEQKREALEELADANDGILVPAKVVEAARDPDHPLHECFTWDQKQAAYERNLDQARALIRSVKIQIEHRTYVVNAPVYTSDTKGDASGYVRTVRLRSERDRAIETMHEEFMRLIGIATRVHATALAVNLTEHAAVAAQVLDLLRTVTDSSEDEDRPGEEVAT